jgi:hypothetical protein
MSDNVIKFPYKIKKTLKPVPTVCQMAAEQFEEILMVGRKKDGFVSMITTMRDPAEVLWHLESAKFGLMNGLEEEEEIDGR